MRILFADSVDLDRLGPLESAGHQYIVEPLLGSEDLPDRLPDFDALVVRSTKVSRAAITAASTLRLIVRAGAGTDNIDTEAASERGIYVCNVPGQNAVAVAELTMGLLIATDRHIAEAASDLRAGIWNKGIYSKAEGLLGKTLAVVGLGEIGMAVAERAKGFGITVTAVKKQGRSEAMRQRIRAVGIRLVDDLPTLLGGADIVSIHIPKASGTTAFVDAEFLNYMRDGATLLNTSRGEMVDEAALLDALNNRGMKAGLDVFANEPKSSDGSFTSALAKHPSVVGSHHIGASTLQAQTAVADATVDVLVSFSNGEIKNSVNMNSGAVGTACISIRHLDRVGVLAAVLTELKSDGINVQQMQNQIFAGGKAGVATINVDAVPNAQILAKLGQIDHVLSATITTAPN